MQKPQLKGLRQNQIFMHFFHSRENNIQFFNRPHPGVVFTKKRRGKPVVKYLINYNVYSNTANSHFYFKIYRFGRHATTAGPITKKVTK